MRRRYLRDYYRMLVDYIKRQDPDAGIGVDIISGFPGETDALFEETYLFLADLPVSYLHAFTYSERPNTPALGFYNTVEPKARFKRTEMLRILSKKKRLAFYRSFLGCTMPVLYESAKHENRLMGFTSNYIRVESPADCTLTNAILNATIRSVDDDHCFAEVISDYRGETIRRNYSSLPVVVMHNK